MKHLAITAGMILSGFASSLAAENRIENMVLIGEIAAVGKQDIIPLPTSPVPYVYLWVM